METLLGDVLFGKTRGRVLRLMLLRADEDFHLRDIVRRTGAGLGPVQREVRLLTEVGVLQRTQRGRQVFYRANREHATFAELRGLVLKTVGMVDVLSEALRRLEERIRCAFVFGSFAKGEETGASDVDLMIVGTVSMSELSRALAEARKTLGRDINPSVYRSEEFALKLGQRHHFVAGVMAGPKVFVIGNEDDLGGLAKERVA